MGAAHFAGKLLGAAVAVCGAHLLLRALTGKGPVARVGALRGGGHEPLVAPPPSDPVDEASWESFPASDPPALSLKNT